MEINFTGRQELETLTSVKITDSIFQSISLDGENLFPAIKNLELFILAKSFFNSTLPKVSMFNSLAFKWWKFRCLWIHQQLIQEKSEMIFNEANVLLQNIELNDMNEKAKIGKCDFFSLASSPLFPRHRTSVVRATQFSIKQAGRLMAGHLAFFW